MPAHGWRRAYHPGAGVLHAHDYSPVGFMRRYFDEYRGLRETSGHVERIGVRSTARDVRGLVAGDRRWMREQGWPRRQQATATGRSVVHHTGRKLSSALGSRAHRLPDAAQRAISLERAAAATAGREADGPRARRSGPRYFGGVLEVAARRRRPAAGPRCPGWPSASGCTSPS